MVDCFVVRKGNYILVSFVLFCTVLSGSLLRSFGGLFRAKSLLGGSPIVSLFLCRKFWEWDCRPSIFVFC